MHQAIRRAYKDEKLWEILVNGSRAQSGPFDGACLVCAKAIVNAAGQGDIVRMTSPLNGGQTEHYGARVNGLIYDFYGSNQNPQEWIDRFAKEEKINDRWMCFADGLDPNSDIVSDDEASKRVADLIKWHLVEVTQNLQKRAMLVAKNTSQRCPFP